MRKREKKGKKIETISFFLFDKFRTILGEYLQRISRTILSTHCNAQIHSDILW